MAVGWNHFCRSELMLQGLTATLTESTAVRQSALPESMLARSWYWKAAWPPPDEKVGTCRHWPIPAR